MTPPPEFEERVRRRVTRRLMPFLILVYITAFLDRANVGVAKLGMQGALGFTEEVIGFGAGIFFAGYFLLEIPGSLIVERWSARRWLARIMITWGLMATLTGFAGMLPGGGSPKFQFYGLRFLLGAAEAGFFPGVLVYLTHWFRQADRTRAKAWFMLAQPLAIVIGTPISRWILETVHWYGLPGWRWVFILEGLPPVLMGFITLWFLPDHPADAKWLPPDEREWLETELERERKDREAAGSTSILAALREPRTTLLAIAFFLIVTGNQAILFFLPTITNNMKTISVAWRTVVATAPYVFSIFGILLNGYWAHRTGKKRLHTALPMFLTAFSLGMAILAGNNLALIITFFCLLGLTFQAYLPVFWSLPPAFLGKSGAAAAIGIINSVGNLGGFVGPYLFGYLRDTTGSFETGMWCLVGSMILAGTFAASVRVEENVRK